MNHLYPLKFTPILKEKIWGGKKLESLLNKSVKGDKRIGESWEISAVEKNVSIVTEGFLEGNSLQDLIEVYMGDLVGDKVYEKFGPEFPLLFKFSIFFFGIPPNKLKISSFSAVSLHSFRNLQELQFLFI